MCQWVDLYNHKYLRRQKACTLIDLLASIRESEEKGIKVVCQVGCGVRTFEEESDRKRSAYHLDQTVRGAEFSYEEKEEKNIYIDVTYQN